MQLEHTPTEQSNEVKPIQTKTLDTSKIKIPDEIMLEAVDAFTFGKTRPQFAEQILDTLPKGLEILAEMDRSEAKKLLCMRLRSADPSSTKFAHKYKQQHREAIKSLSKTFKATLPTEIANTIHVLRNTSETLTQVDEKLQKMLQDNNMDTRELHNSVKVLLQTHNSFRENSKTIIEMIDLLDKACSHYEYQCKHPFN